MKNPFIFLIAFSLVSCAIPKKALIIAEGPSEKPKQGTKALSKPSEPAAPVDDLRMPDMLALPDEEQLRSTAPEASGDATVITRPPKE